MALIIGLRIHGSQLMCSLPNPIQQYSKHQTTAEAIEECLDEGLEPTYYFSIFSIASVKNTYSLRRVPQK